MNNYRADSNSTIKEIMIDKKALMEKLDLPEAVSEMQVQKSIKSLAEKNKTDYGCFIGADAYKRFIPASISQISSRFEFNTAYTSYQPEIPQGTLRVIYEFQSVICGLTGMAVCNAPVYYAGCACAEAVFTAARISGKKKILISSLINLQYKAGAGGIQTAEIKNIESIKEELLSGGYAGIIENPDFCGTIKDIDKLSSLSEAEKTLLIVCIEPVSASVLKKPEGYNADIAAGDVQSSGSPASFSAFYAGFIAVSDRYKRQISGRTAGRTFDKDGKQALALTIQAGEQHIRRKKTAGNICSNQNPAILNASIYIALLGKKGIMQSAYLSAENARIPAGGLEAKNYKILVCTTEINTAEEINNYIKSA